MMPLLPDARIAAIAGTAVPAMADFCLIYVLRGEHLRCAALAHATAAGERLLRALTRVYRITRHDPGSTVAQVVRLGRHSLRGDIRPEDDAASTRLNGLARVVALHRRLGVRSALVVPIKGISGVLGAAAFAYSTSGRRYTSGDVRVAERIARQVARTIENAPLLNERAAEERRLTRTLRLRARA